MVNTRTEYSRTMEAMQEKAPNAKMARSADFSRTGRWMLRSKGRGRIKMNMSMRMLSADVAVHTGISHFVPDNNNLGSEGVGATNVL
jgi:hypothetical protein